MVVQDISLAMSEKKPKTILTNQNVVKSKAIFLVMPNSYHQLCVFHLGNNIHKYLNHLYEDKRSNGRRLYEYL